MSPPTGSLSCCFACPLAVRVPRRQHPHPHPHHHRRYRCSAAVDRPERPTPSVESRPITRPTLNAPGTQTKSAEATTTLTPTPTYAGAETTTAPTTTDRPGQLSADGDPGDDVSLLPRMLDDDRGAHHGAGPHEQEVSEEIRKRRYSKTQLIFLSAT